MEAINSDMRSDLIITSNDNDSSIPLEQPSGVATASTISEHPEAAAAKAKPVDEEDDCFSSCLVNVGCGIGSCILAFVALIVKGLSCLCTPFSMLYKWFKK